MRSSPTVLAFAFALCCLAAPARAAASDAAAGRRSDAEDGKSQLIVPMQSGAYVIIRTESAPPSAADATSNLIEAEYKPNLLHRVFIDSRKEFYFGYELLVERAAEARYFWVSVRPLSEEYLQTLQARPAFRGRRLHPSYNATAFPAAAQFLRDGDTFALDVFRNPRTGAKLVDVIQVSLRDPSLRQAANDQPPRDFSVEQMQLKVSDYKLRVNGETVYRSPGGCAGSLIWFSLGGRGRFVFSLVPRPGQQFQKVGAVRHKTISFEWDGDRYEWESSTPVVGTGGNWNLWVLADPDYSVELFEQPTPAAERDKTFARQHEEAVRDARRARAQPGFGSANAATEPGTAAPPRRTRVVIGSADGVEHLFPRQQK